MKTLNQLVDSDSFSTQQKQRKFYRKSQGRRSSLSNSSKSDSQSLSKFYVRNLQTQQKSQKVHQMINKNINPRTNWSPPRRKPTPSKTQKQKKITFTTEQLLQSRNKQIQSLNHQMSKYRLYIQNQSDKIHQFTKENVKLKEEINILKRQIQQQKISKQALKRKIFQLNENLTYKQIMLQYWQKEQPAIKKVKTSIFQARMIQFDKQKQQLNRKIHDLQAIIEDFKNNSIIHSSDSQKQISFGFGLGRNSLPVEKSIYYNQQHLQNIQQELYQAKEEIKKLNIAQRCNKRKFYKQLEIYKQKKDKQYKELKNKFQQFLVKYKTTMKKVASFQAKHALQVRNKQRSNSIQSLVSLTLSQENQ